MCAAGAAGEKNASAKEASRRRRRTPRMRTNGVMTAAGRTAKLLQKSADIKERNSEERSTHR